MSSIVKLKQVGHRVIASSYKTRCFFISHMVRKFSAVGSKICLFGFLFIRPSKFGLPVQFVQFY